MKGKTLKIAVCSFLCGVFLYDSLAAAGKLFFVFLSFAFFFCLITYKKNKILFFVSVALLFCVTGLLRHNYAYPKINESSVHYYQSEENRVTLKGVIAEDPDRRRDKVNYILEADEIIVKGVSNTVSGRVLVLCDLYPEYDYGDTLNVTGILISPPEFDTFSYKNYLKIDNVHSVMFYPSVRLIEKNNRNIFFSVLYTIKENFEGRLNRLFPEPMASFEAGLLTGSRKGIPEDLMQNFNITGLTHIIAISGYNISLIIFFISSLLKKSSRRIKVPATIIMIAVFTLFVGASAAVVRASVMGIISVLAMWFGRQSEIINALLLSAFFMVFYNPFILLYDVGFQLSFLATLGLIITGNSFNRFFSFLPEIFGLREAFAMTFSAQVFALPVILANFKRLSVISPVANVFVVPVIPFAMLFGFCSVILSYFNHYFGMLFMFPAWLVLKYCISVTEILAGLPWASYEVDWFSGYMVLIYFAVFILLAYFVYPYSGNLFRRI
jgi:competence protein ComEC